MILNTVNKQAFEKKKCLGSESSKNIFVWEISLDADEKLIIFLFFDGDGI